MQTAVGLRAFGLSLGVEGALPPGEWEPQPWSEPALSLRVVTPEAVQGSWSGRAAISWQAAIDGAPFTVELGRAGDHLFVHGDRSVHHLSADASLLQCAPCSQEEPSWWRVVLDSVLFTVALLHGYEALHAGAVAGSDGVIAITAASGGGKSTLLSELIQRGLALMADDVLVLESEGGAAPLAHPGPPLMTVPGGRVPTLTTGLPARTICSVGEELWIAVPAHPGALAMRALVVLDRRPGLEGSLRRIDEPLAPLLGSLMNFPDSPERRRARFELASALASTTTLWRLSADLETTPGELADTLLAGEL